MWMVAAPINAMQALRAPGIRPAPAGGVAVPVIEEGLGVQGFGLGLKV